MWSEIFTHNFDNGDKVAIILLDTQGTFDHRASMRQCTTIFAMSTLLSSVQCYNVMQNIKEDDLQHLQLFTDYASLVQKQTKSKPFQYLLFVVRDWPDPEIEYGWSQQIVDETLAETDEQTSSMHNLRKHIKNSFEEIGAFLMPHPGQQVVRSKNFNGRISEIDSTFLHYMKILVSSLLAPENLVVKTINGEKVKAGDLIQYLTMYSEAFSGENLQEPTTLLMVSN